MEFRIRVDVELGGVPRGHVGGSQQGHLEACTVPLAQRREASRELIASTTKTAKCTAESLRGSGESEAAPPAVLESTAWWLAVDRPEQPLERSCGCGPRRLGHKEPPNLQVFEELGYRK